MSGEKPTRTTAQEQRERDRAEYEQKTKKLLFTKDFQSRQEVLMRDPLATVGERVMACILRRSWGEYVLYAVRDDGEPFYQRDICLLLGLHKTTVSHTVAYFQRRGYLEDRPKLLYPVISPVLASPPEKGKKLREYATFYEDWKVAYSTYFEREEVARSTLKEIRIVRNSHYKKWRKAQKEAAATLLETGESISETARLAAVSPFERDVQRHQDSEKNQPKSPTKEGGTHDEHRFEPRAYLFAQIAHMQQAYAHTTFAKPPIDPTSKAHQNLMNLILAALRNHDEDHLVGYTTFVAFKFKGIGVGGHPVRSREPGKANGPDGLGLLVGWAEDYARIELGRAG